MNVVPYLVRLPFEVRGVSGRQPETKGMKHGSLQTVVRAVKTVTGGGVDSVRGGSAWAVSARQAGKACQGAGIVTEPWEGAAV